MMHFPPVSALFLQVCLFPKNFFTFIRQNFCPFLVIDHKFRICPPIFAVSVHFPPVSRKLFFPPTFTNFPPILGKFTCFLHTLRVFCPPTLTMMHLCITQCTYWTPLHIAPVFYRPVFCFGCSVPLSSVFEPVADLCGRQPRRFGQLPLLPR